MKTELFRLLVALRASHALSDSEFETVQDSLSECDGETAVGRLLQDLVQAQQLTSYQAKRLAAGQKLLLGEYIIEELLGEGGMGQVFKATHLRLKRPAALKVIHEKYLLSDPQSAARFLREGRAIARLKHPNIVTAYDASVQEGMHFLVMEYIEGVTLGQLVAVGGSLSIDQSLDFLTQAAEALEYAHGQGVVHRDIKPNNLMVERSTNKIKVLDLGVARLASDKQSEAFAEELTATGEIMGTFDYMAPEQANDAKLVDHRADIYSLGCTLYLMITGKRIYEHATNRFEKARAHREDPIPGLGTHRADVPDTVTDLYEQMVKKDPDQRLQSMAEVIDRAQQIRGTMFRDGSTTVTMKPSRKIGAPGSDEAGGAISEAVSIPGAAKPDSPRRRGALRPMLVLVAVTLLVAAAVLFGPPISEKVAQWYRGSTSPAPVDVGAHSNASKKAGPIDEEAKAVADRLESLDFLVETRREVEGDGAAKFVAEIHVIRPGGPPEIVHVDSDFTDDDFRDASDAKQVEVLRLDLGGTQIVDADLKRLAVMTELEHLSLHKCELLTDEAFRPLEGLKNLKSIDLRMTRLSGAGLQLLPDAPLEELDVDGFHGKLTGKDIVEVADRFETTLKRISAQGIKLDPAQEERLRPLLQGPRAENLAPDVL